MFIFVDPVTCTSFNLVPEQVWTDSQNNNNAYYRGDSLPDSDLQQLYYTGAVKAIEMSVIKCLTVYQVPPISCCTGKSQLFTVEGKSKHLKYKYRGAGDTYNNT